MSVGRFRLCGCLGASGYVVCKSPFFACFGLLLNLSLDLAFVFCFGKKRVPEQSMCSN